VPDDALIDRHFTHFPGYAENLLNGDYRLQVFKRMPFALLHDQLDFLLLIGVADTQLHGKPIQLRLRKRIGAVVLYRILGCDDHVGSFKGIGPALDGYLPLAHALKQGRLCSGGCTVDFIRQKNVAEDRAGTEIECTFLSSVDHSAQDVRRQQVRREMDTVK